ncbi:MAG: HAMP domain-containing histidine kinase [Lachnospiraceae bacterium]|jgi:signal transduction histidine kinase|nr:HAMP domain-containing histidine kinase [Lachnospiraceae bacterium]
MKHSIKRQMLAAFIGIIVFLLSMLMIVNIVFLEQFYTRRKENAFIDIYNQMKTALQDKDIKNGAIEDNKELVSIQNLANKSNIVFRINIADNEAITNTNDVNSADLNLALEGYRLGKKSSSVVKEPGKKSSQIWQITETEDKKTGNNYLEMWGRLDGNTFFIMRTSLFAIHEMADTTNSFLLQIGGLIVLLCMAMVYYFAQRITDPILELAGLSEQMAEMNFDAKYTGGGDDEIGILGENFNKMSSNLELAVKDLKKANFDLQKDIEQKEKLEENRSDFISNVSHELKTPIALIQGYAEGLRDGITDDPESMEFYCDVIMDEATKMNRMVKNLLTLSQLEYGDSDMVLERFDLIDMIKGVVNSLELFIKQEDINVQFDDTMKIMVWADEFKMEQVVRNYLTNAIHHIGGDKVIDINMELVGEKVKVGVFNTGNPIPADDLEHLWDKFYKVDKAHTREYGGNGIGLSIVKAIMDSLHQEYGATNYDNGVEFWFTLDRK